MLEEKGSDINLIEIYVKLIGEGTMVFRPTHGELIGEGLFRLLPTEDYDPEDEAWEFLPGSVVRGEMRRLDGGEVIIAVSSS